MFDRVLAIILLIILLPLMIFISLVIYIFSGSPIIFKQPRCGYEFKDFIIYKFRTMKLNNGLVITQSNDNRITPIGYFLRQLKMDELPQLMNVILGHMTFVGPRPEIPEIANLHPQYFNYLNENKPGITDINSIIFKDEGKIFNINNVEEYISKVLPLKAQLTQLNYKKVSKIDQLSIIAISIVALLHYQFSLRIISKFFLSCNNYEIRKRLNNLLSVEIF